jgi:hypothetical protein
MRNVIIRSWVKKIIASGRPGAGVKIEDRRQTMNADRVEIFGKDT